MSRLLCQFVSSLTLVGYLVVVTWGPAWHDHHHHHGHCHSHGANTSSAAEAGHSHGPCCAHHHSQCSQDAKSSEPGSEPCPLPLHDDDCLVCQVLAHPPLAPPAIEVVDVSEPVPAWVEVFAPSPAYGLSPVYDSRGPPLV